MKKLSDQGKLVEALLILLQRLTPIAKWVLVLLLVIYSLSGIRTVKPNENALILRLGRLSPEVHGPGLLFALPKPFDDVIVFQTDREHNILLDDWAAQGQRIANESIEREATEAEREEQGIEGGSGVKITEKAVGNSLDPVTDGYTLTGDHNLVQGRFVMRYRIVDPFAYFNAGDAVGSMLSQIAYRSLTRSLSTRDIDRSLTDDRQRITAEIRQSTQDEAEKLKLGVSITAIEIRALTPPTQVLPAFEDVVNARQFAKTLVKSAEEHERRTLIKSEGEANNIMHRAEGYASEILAASRGEAHSFVAFNEEYQKAPVLTTERLYWDSFDRVMRKINSRALLPAKQTKPSIMVEPAPEFLR